MFKKLTIKKTGGASEASATKTRASSPRNKPAKETKVKAIPKTVKTAIIKNEAKLPPAESIVLYEHQKPHVDALEEILSENYCAFDMSVMGSGKTYTTSQIALSLEFKHVIVVCPASLESKWKSMAQYGVPLSKVISYQSLRSRKGAIPRHGLLNRVDIFDEGEISVIFTPTEEYNRIVEEGCLLVFDEVQNFKNKNDQFMACQTLTTTILRSGGTSRIMFLSGTPFDKEKHSIHMMEMMGLIRSHKLYIYSKEENKLKLLGAQELVDFCKLTDPKGTLQLLKDHPFSKENVHHVCYLLFQKIVKKNLSRAMPPPKLDVEPDSKNGYYKIVNDEDRTNLIKGIIQLQSSVMYNEKTGAIDVSRGNFSMINPSLHKIEKSKVNSFVRVAKKYLDDKPTCKVVLAFNFGDSIESAKEQLGDYNPLVLNGSVLKHQRKNIIDKFQENNNTYRVLICNVIVASTGIDLDDKFGGHPRYAFVSPNYRILDLHQFIYRFYRSDTKGMSFVRFFYGDIGRKETSILNSISKKSNVMKDTTEEYTGKDMKYPGDLESEVEM